MEKVVVELFTDQRNCPVLKVPQRQFPGVLVPGDTLDSLIKDFEAIGTTIRRSLGDAEPCNRFDAIVSRLKLMRETYVSALIQHDLKLPFNY